MKTPSSRETGSTITVAIIITTMLAAFVALAVDYTSHVGRMAQRDRVFNNAVEIGDGCLELAFGSWRKLAASAGVKNPPTATFANIPQPIASYFPSFPNAVISNFRVQAVTPTVELASDHPPVSSLGANDPPIETTGPGEGTFSYFYLATVDVTLPYLRGTLTAKVRRIFERRYTSAVNWQMLMNDNLELHPNSPLTMNGWVHTNGNLYVGNGMDGPTPAPTATPDPNDPNPPPTPTPVPTATPNLTLTDRMTYAGNYTLGFHPNDQDHAGQTNLADPASPADLPPGSEQVYYPFNWKPSLFNNTNGNGNDDGFHEVIEKPVAGTDPVAQDRLYNQANVAIEVDAAGVVKVYTGTGPTKTLVTGTSGSSSSLNSTAYTAAQAAVLPGYSIQDAREVTTMRVTNFDVAQFKAKFGTSITNGWNGIVFIRDASSTSSSRGAIRIVNGASLPAGGMTIVSENPVYVQGDFNTGRSSGTEPASNLGDPADPDVTGYTRQPSSIMGDAITLLSNAWTDANNSKGLTDRVAANTTVNSLLVTGNVPSAGGHYSGGGENFVRFLEDWSGKSFTYYGSMIGMFTSKEASGWWGKANVYKSPTLKWYFDKTLSVDDAGNPVKIPGYVSTVAYLQQQRWYLQY
jgi:hypothetical protein